eukprot:615588_1
MARETTPKLREYLIDKNLKHLEVSLRDEFCIYSTQHVFNYTMEECMEIVQFDSFDLNPAEIFRYKGMIRQIRCDVDKKKINIMDNVAINLTTHSPQIKSEIKVIPSNWDVPNDCSNNSNHNNSNNSNNTCTETSLVNITPSIGSESVTNSPQIHNVVSQIELEHDIEQKSNTYSITSLKLITTAEASSKRGSGRDLVWLQWEFDCIANNWPRVSSMRITQKQKANFVAHKLKKRTTKEVEERGYEAKSPWRTTQAVLNKMGKLKYFSDHTSKKRGRKRKSCSTVASPQHKKQRQK